MIIEIKEDGTNLVSILQSENGRKKEKIITMDSLISSISSSSKKGNFEIIKSPLYKEVMGTKLIQSKQYAKNSTVYILHRKKFQAPMQIFSRFHGDVGYPGLLFAVYVVNNRLSRLNVIAVKDDVIDEGTKLYKYPYTNVSGNDGKVCLGANFFGKGILDGEKLYNVPNEFFSMPNTLHSYSNKNNTKGYEFEEMIISLKNKEFDNELLVNNNKLLTYIEWFNIL